MRYEYVYYLCIYEQIDIDMVWRKIRQWLSNTQNHIYIYISISLSLSLYIYICIYIYISIYIDMCIYIYIEAAIFICVKAVEGSLKDESSPAGDRLKPFQPR